MKRKMFEERPRVLVLTSTFPRWKKDVEPPFVFELCQRLSDRFRITVLAPHTSGAKSMERMNGMWVIRFHYFVRNLQLLAYSGGILPNLKQHPWRGILVPFFLASEMRALARLLKSERPDLIHAHWLLPQGLVAALVLRVSRSSVPLLCTSHGGDMYGLRGRFFDGTRRFVLKQSTGLTVVSRAMRDEALSKGAREKATQVIPMGVDLKETFTPFEASRRVMQLLFVGRLVEKKGLSYLLKAMPSILRSHPGAKLTIVGSGPEETSLRGEAATLGLADQVDFAGPIENSRLPSLYREAEIVVFPSSVAQGGDQEGFGLVLVEALGCECAVVATDLPAVRDIIIHGTTGLLVPEKNVEMLARAIIALLGDSELRTALGREGRRFVVARYDWTVIADRYGRFIEELIGCRDAGEA